MKNIFITGGAGYVGSSLVPRLLRLGYNVTVYDLLIYGENVLEPHKNLKILKGDIRDQTLLKKSIINQDIVIHLACISNDPSFELNPKLGKSINLESFEPLVKICKKNNVRRFLYASSSSVYGLKTEKNVCEDISLEPLTDYSKYKADCEKILNGYGSDDFVVSTLRPATVCGYAPRQRLDVSVNILTNFAVNKNQIKVFGGDQLRPNLHIKDYCDLVQLLIKSETKKIKNEIFNVGYQNMSINQISLLVKKVVEKQFPEKGEIKIFKEKSDDNRSYHINSDKIKNKLGFIPQRSIENAVEDLCDAFRNNLLPNSFKDENYFNVKKLKSINAK